MKILLTLLSTVILVTACNRCEDEIICTEEFRMIVLTLKDNSEQPGILDSSYTIRQSTSEKIRPEQSMGAGYYVVLDDAYHPQLKNKEDNFRFVGWKNNTIVVDELYKIAADNCHILKRSGADTLSLQ